MNDGTWQTLKVEAKKTTSNNSTTTTTSVMVNGSTIPVNSTKEIFDDVWMNTVQRVGLTLGGLPSLSSPRFIGCIKDVTIGGNAANIEDEQNVIRGCVSMCTPDDPCQNGQCIDFFDDYKCNCDTHYTGRNCDTTFNVTCAFNPQPCVNGTCETLPDPVPRSADTVSQEGFDFFKCNCNAGYEGYLCNTATNECDPNPCVHATCTDLHIDYRCACETGWEGKNCSKNINECSLSVCKNGGACTDLSPGYNCACPKNWTGTDCTVDVDECLEADTCKNNATCKNTAGGYSCTCKNGYFGNNCEQNNTMFCDLFSPCKNGATCSASMSGYQCECTEGWAGVNCSTNINECTLGFCKNGATCTDSAPGYTCVCTSNWQGKNCTQDIDECELPSPCKNNATCQNTAGSYTCECKAGYFGTNCEYNNTMYCEVRTPCQNGGICSDSMDNPSIPFTCDCKDGFSGEECEVPGKVAEDDTNWGLIIGVPVAAVVLILLIIIICLIKRCRDNSGLEGTYSPNKEEQQAGPVEMVLKKPNTERLI